MQEIAGTLGVAIVLVVITLIVVMFILSLLMPFFVCLINNRLKELLHEQREANQAIHDELKKLNTQVELSIKSRQM